MSEGNGAAVSNGAPAPTTAAPSVAPVIEPKSGEGAVAPKAEAPKWQAIKTKLKYGNGEEEEVELSDEETLQRKLLAAKGFDKAQKERLALERKESARKEALAKKDYTPLKELGFDPEAYFQERLESEAKRHNMTEQERQLDDATKAKTKAEAMAKDAVARLRAKLEEEQDKREWEELSPRLAKAMKAEGMLNDTFAGESIAAVAREFLNAGLDVPPEVVIKEAAARDNDRFDKRLSGLTPQTAPRLWSKLPPEVRKMFGYLAAKDHIKARSNIPEPVAPVPPQREAEPKPEQHGGLTPRDWLKSLRGG